MESSSAEQHSVNLGPQGSSMEAEPIIPTVDVDSPKSAESDVRSSPYTRPIDLEEEEENKEESQETQPPLTPRQGPAYRGRVPDANP